MVPPPDAGLHARSVCLEKCFSWQAAGPEAAVRTFGHFGEKLLFLPPVR